MQTNEKKNEQRSMAFFLLFLVALTDWLTGGEKSRCHFFFFFFFFVLFFSSMHFNSVRFVVFSFFFSFLFSFICELPKWHVVDSIVNTRFKKITQINTMSRSNGSHTPIRPSMVFICCLLFTVQYHYILLHLNNSVSHWTCLWLGVWLCVCVSFVYRFWQQSAATT